MLRREDIARLARVRGLAPWQEEKRYVQAVALYALRRHPLVFKGGTYLWFFHGLDRFSEDLDFTAGGRLPDALVPDALESLRLFGISATAKSIKDDRFVLSFRIDATGPLYVSQSDTCRVRVEISRRENVALEPLENRLDEPGYGLPIDFVRGMALGEVLAEKVRALLRRGEARDLYDLWFLAERKRTGPDRGLVDKKLGFYGERFEVSDFVRAMDGLRGAWDSGLGSVVMGSVPSFSRAKEDLARWAEALR